MHTPEEQPWDGGDVFEEITVSNVADFRALRQDATIEIIVRDADIPVDFSYGFFRIQAPLGYVLEALTAEIPEMLSNLETRISETRGATLPLVGFWDSVPGAIVVIESVVSGGELE